MKKKIAVYTFVGMCLGFIVGLVLIFSAPTRGFYEGTRFVRRMGGSVDTNQFEILIEGTIISYQAGGFVISLVGGLGMIVSGYVLHKEL